MDHPSDELPAAGPAGQPMRRVLARLMARQESQIAQFRAASAAIDAELQRLGQPTLDGTINATLTRQRELIGRSQATIRHTCESIERSSKLIARSGDVLARGASRRRSRSRATHSLLPNHRH